MFDVYKDYSNLNSFSLCQKATQPSRRASRKIYKKLNASCSSPQIDSAQLGKHIQEFIFSAEIKYRRTVIINSDLHNFEKFRPFLFTYSVHLLCLDVARFLLNCARGKLSNCYLVIALDRTHFKINEGLKFISEDFNRFII